MTLAALDGFTQRALLLIEPIGLLWLALIVLTVLLWRKSRRGFALATGSMAAAIYAIGATSLPSALVRSLEAPYLGVKFDALPASDAIVMLGGGIEPSASEPTGLHLTRAADRVFAALELIRLGKAPVLVCGGSAMEIDGREIVEADALRQALIERRVPVPEIVSLGRCADTHDEAVRTRALAGARGWRRVLLVTSASHMRRARATFRTAGVNAEPASCNFLSPLAGGRWRLGIPGHGGFEGISIWMHEQIGWWEYRRRGWIE
jgi:uncharacterized SAM-binding protein YcdF (DUF218 family)